MQEMHERLSIFKECMPRMRGKHQDRAWWHEKRRRNLLEKGQKENPRQGNLGKLWVILQIMDSQNQSAKY